MAQYAHNRPENLTMPTKRITMADIKRRSLARGSHYFERATSRFFGPESFYGPYVGPHGMFFVQRNKAGIKVKAVGDDYDIHTVMDDFDTVTDAREAAKKLAGKSPRAKKVSNPSRKRKPAAKRNPARSMTKEQAVREFRSIYPAGSFVGRSGRLDKPMAREAWNNFTDSLNRDRRITDAQYARWSGLPQYSDRKRR